MDRKVHIILAEDDVIMARLQRFSLEKLISGAPVMCKNGKEAIDFLDAEKEELEGALVILDLNMPVMNGWDFLEACQDRPYSEKLQVVVVTSSLFREDQERAAEYEQVIGYYTKPVSPKKFKEILELPEVAEIFDRYFIRGK
ncbi:MAG TPA: response regulator [Salinimicrobium catena]|uniref:Response regulator n=1 Tax=Salinimicrobium catena TaxID=390640 RepID=A0A7C2R2B0_9FLAO|nr:response regulator [Salinimicrobium catena]